MLENYYVDKKKKENGQHEVHKDWCIDIPSPDQQLFLGSFRTDKLAVEEATFFFGKVCACTKCCES